MTAGDLDTTVPAVVLKLFHGGLAVARTLGRLGVEVHGVSPDRRQPATRSRFLAGVHLWDIDKAPEHESLEWLVELGRRIGRRPLLVPTEDAGAMFVADNAEALLETFRFPEQPRGLARRLSSKEGMDALCQEHSIPTPVTVLPRSLDDLERFAESTPFPVVLKVVDGSRLEQESGPRVIVARTADELRSGHARLAARDGGDVLLQEYVPGGADSVWMFNGYFDADSECRLGITGQKLRQYPPYTGFTSLGVARDNEAVRETTRRFMKELGYRGVLDIGYRYDARDGRYKLLDVNPRVGTTFRLFVATDGLDVVRALYLDLTGQPLTDGHVQPERKWMIEDLDLASSLTYFRNGELGPRRWLASYRGVREAAWFARDDPLPFVAMVRRTLVKRLWGGVRTRLSR